MVPSDALGVDRHRVLAVSDAHEIVERARSLVGRSDREAGLRHLAERGEDLAAGRVVEDRLGRARLAPVAVVDEGRAADREHLVEEARVGLEAERRLRDRVRALDLRGRRLELGERGRRLVRVETSRSKGLLVVVQHRARNVEGHRVHLALDRVVADDAGQEVREAVLVGLGARARRQHRGGVDHLLLVGFLQHHDVGEVAAREAGLVLRERVVVADLADQTDLHVGLRRVELVGQLLQRLLVRAGQRMPHRDLDGLARLGQGFQRAGRPRRPRGRRRRHDRGDPGPVATTSASTRCRDLMRTIRLLPSLVPIRPSWLSP